jgi:hypothetical protein
LGHRWETMSHFFVYILLVPESIQLSGTMSVALILFFNRCNNYSALRSLTNFSSKGSSKSNNSERSDQVPLRGFRGVLIRSKYACVSSYVQIYNALRSLTNFSNNGSSKLNNSERSDQVPLRGFRGVLIRSKYACFSFLSRL